MSPILSAATSTLAILKEDPILATLHFLRDLLAYGSPNPPTSHFADERQPDATASPQLQAAIKSLVEADGEALTQRVMAGMMYTFPADCIPDASGMLLAMFQLTPQITATWVAGTINMLPAGSITQQEQERMLRNIDQYVAFPTDSSYYIR